MIDYWVIDDWRLDDDNQYIPASVTEDFWGRSAGQFTLNGKVKPVLPGIADERRRVRVVNGSNNTIISLKIDNHQLRIIAKDGTPVDEPWQTRSVRLATGERVDIDLKLTGKPNSDYTVRLEAFSNMFGPAGREVNKEARWTINDWSFPDYEDMHFDMGSSRLIEISNNTPMSHPFHLHGHFFRVVGRSKRGTPPSGGGSKQVMLATLRYGQGRAETLDEPSLPSHGIPSADQTKSLSTPMILGTSGVGGMGGGGMGGNTPVALTKRDKRSWQDTVEVSPSQTVQLLLLADNPGDWMYHCHILENEESGMMGVFRVGAKP
jgi:FtsP/CotA-like multicopper oxidase with cupredoxin domain